MAYGTNLTHHVFIWHVNKEWFLNGCLKKNKNAFSLQSLKYLLYSPLKKNFMVPYGSP